MALSASFEIGTQYLAGNPILLNIHLTPGNSITYEVSETGTGRVIFTGTFFSIQEITTINIRELFQLNNVEDGLKEYTIKLLNKSVVIQSANVEVYPGAIGKRMFRELVKRKLDIFGVKLNPSDQNFLLTTRTFGKTIFIPEDELFPLAYYRRNKVFTVCDNSTVIKSLDFTNQIQGVEYVNVKEIRKANFDATGKVSSVLALKTADNAVSANIVITEAVQEHKYFIKFRNSLGAFEAVALNNVVEFAPEVKNSMIEVYDALIADSISVNYLTSYKEKYNAELRQLAQSELLFALDMLLSKEQYLVSEKGEIRVLIKPKDQLTFTTSGIPAKVTLEIESVEEERYYTPLDLERIKHIYESIFSKEFTIEYN